MTHNYVTCYSDTHPLCCLTSNINVNATNYEVTLNNSWGICVDISQTCTLFQSYIKHEICRLPSLIQGPTCSSFCNIASLAKNQKSICPDLVWTDKMCVTGTELSAASAGTFPLVMMTQGGIWGLIIIFLFDKVKTEL